MSNETIDHGSGSHDVGNCGYCRKIMKSREYILRRVEKIEREYKETVFQEADEPGYLAALIASEFMQINNEIHRLEGLLEEAIELIGGKCEVSDCNRPECKNTEEFLKKLEARNR